MNDCTAPVSCRMRTGLNSESELDKATAPSQTNGSNVRSTEFIVSAEGTRMKATLLNVF